MVHHYSSLIQPTSEYNSFTPQLIMVLLVYEPHIDHEECLKKKGRRDENIIVGQ